MNHTEQFNKIMQRANSTAAAKKKQAQASVIKIQPVENMNDLQISISKCTIKGNAVLLPEEKIDNYQDLRQAFLKSGAQYKRNSFIFPSDPKPFIDRLMQGEKVNMQKEYQAFFTPPGVAQWMATNAMLNHVADTDLVLEPNGGNGALIKAMREEGFKGTMYTYELNPIYQDVLKQLDNVVLLGADFLEADKKWNGKFHRIIANPPFSKNQDIDHIYKMWELLAPGGTIVTVASTHWKFSNNKKEKAFRTWIDEKEASIYPLDNGKFKESGTMVASCILVIDKP